MANLLSESTNLDTVVHLSAEDLALATKLAENQKVSMDVVLHRALHLFEEELSAETQDALRMMTEMNISLDGFIKQIREDRASIRETLDVMSQRAAERAAAEKAA